MILPLCRSSSAYGSRPSFSSRRRPPPRSRRSPAAPAPSPAPLSFAQQRLWFLDRLEPNSCQYNVADAFRLEGALQIEALQQALDGVVARHAALRTTFAAADGSPVQLIAPARPVELSLLDLRGRPEAERAAATEAALVEAIRRPFDLTRDLLLRATLIQLAEHEHVLLLLAHHIAFDGWSAEILLRELGALYEAARIGAHDTLPELPLQYADFAVWQRAWLQGKVLIAQLAYWRQQLAGVPALLELPTDRPRPKIQTQRGARRSIVLPRSLSVSLQTLGQQEGATLFMTLLAAFTGLLARWTGQDDVVVGSPIAGRNRVEIEGLIGFFVNTLALRIDLSGKPTFRELLRRARAVTLEAYEHQDLPFEKLVEELQPVRSLGHTPLFQVLFVLQNNAPAELKLTGVAVEPQPADLEAVKFDLSLSLSERPNGLHASLTYNTDLFEADTIARLLNHYQNLLAGATADPDRPFGELPLLSEAERHQLLIGWNQTAVDYPDASIQELFEAQAARTPEAVALVHEGQQLTYGELNARANQLAHQLRQHGIGPDVPVGLCLERSFDLIVGLLGILKAGGAYVPLDPAYPRERLAFLLTDTQAPVLLTHSRLRERLPTAAVRVVCVDADAEAIARQSAANPTRATSADNLAYVTYTSGSTGKPKGVLVPHRGVVRLLCGVAYVHLDAAQTLLHLSPLAFDSSTFEIWGALLHGGRCVLFPERIPSVGELGHVLAQHPVSVLWLTASLFNTIVEEAPQILSGVRQLLVGGEALSVRHVRRALEMLPDTTISNGYGPTEGTTFTCCYRIPRDLPADAPSVPIGRPIANTRIYVLDRHGQPAPVGVAGELFIAGAGLARGYRDRPELTAERFVPNPFGGSGDRLYRSGDRVRWRADGQLEFLGRLDRQVKLRGHRIELEEIEAVLGRHPDVAQAAAVIREDQLGDPRLTAYLVARRGVQLAAATLREFLQQLLPPPLVPSAFVVLDTLPLTSNGKIDRRALPAPDPASAEPANADGKPQTDHECRLARIWCDVLGVEAIGVDDDFFALGGHSLLAIQLFARIEKAFGQNLPLATLFQGPTIRRLAARLVEQTRPRVPRQVVILQPEGSRPPLFLLPSLFFDHLHYQEVLRHLGPDQPVYGLVPCDDDGTIPGFTRLEDMAERILKGLLAFRPEGPYCMAGYSFGGPLAYELAQQLVAVGQRVGLLAFIDTGLSRGQKATLLALLRSLPPMLGNLPSWVRDDLLQSRPGELLNRLRRKLQAAWQKAQRFLGRGGPTAEYVVLDELFGMERFENRFQKRLEMNYRAWSRYRPRVYPDRVTLLCARTRRLWQVSAGGAGLKGLAAGGVAVRVVPGNHDSILKEPHVRVLAQCLRDSIDECADHEARSES